MFINQKLKKLKMLNFNISDKELEALDKQFHSIENKINKDDFIFTNHFIKRCKQRLGFVPTRKNFELLKEHILQDIKYENLDLNNIYGRRIRHIFGSKNSTIVYKVIDDTRKHKKIIVLTTLMA